MVFPTSYTIENQAGGPSSDVESMAGEPRQLLINTDTWEILLMDGVTMGGHTQVSTVNLTDFLQNNTYIKHGSKALVEAADPTAVSPPTTHTEQLVWSAMT